MESDSNNVSSAKEAEGVPRSRLRSEEIQLPVPPPQLPPPPRLHVTSERIPVLPSAPPSGADILEYAGESFGTESAMSATSVAGISESSPLTSTTTSPVIPTMVMDLPPPPRMSGAATKIDAAGTLVDIPPPPPPPPPPPVYQEQEGVVYEEEDEGVGKGELLFERDLQAPSPQVKEPTRVFFPPSWPVFLARRHTHIPILVIATEHANKIAWKNNLRLTDMLEGLAKDLSSVNMPLPPFRSSSRSMLMSWEHLKVSFVSPEDMEENLSEDDALSQAWLHEEAALKEGDGSLADDMAILEDQIDHLLAETHHESTGGMSQDDATDTHTMDMYKKRQRRLEQVTRDAFKLTSPPNIPWLVRYRSTLDATTDYLSHELFHTPPLVLLVCCSYEVTSPLNCLRDLGSPHYLPQTCFGKSGIMDPHQLRQEFLVLHDNQEGPQDFDEASLKQQLQRQFGNGAAILRINSIHPSTAAQLAKEESSDLWNGDGNCGNCLSVSDRSLLRRYIATLITSSLLPSLERRIADLNMLVTDKKKGVKNVFKSLWRKPKDEASPSTKRTSTPTGAAVYRHDSIESQVRLLADTLFLLRDWEAALGMYKLIRDDYKHDRALLHHASVQEMMALSTYMLDSFGRSREVFSYLETALYSYTRAAEESRPGGMTRPTEASVATRLATRLCLVLSSMSQIDRPLEVADLLASASSHETPLGAAVLLEQSSAHYYRAEMFRKYAFHMLMSGHMFRSAAQEHHALRCFISSLYIYNDGRWDELHSHLISALAAQLYSLGRMAVSMELYAKLVGTDGGGRVSVKSQQKFVNHLLEICKDHTKKALVGADRMAARGPGAADLGISHLDQLEEILRYTPHSRRVLEIPSMDLPCLDDSSVKVMVEAEASEQHETIPSLGSCAHGDESVWEELMCQFEAERKTAELGDLMSMDELPRALTVIEDPVTRSVIAQIDKERTNMSMLARAKKSGNNKASPAVRARMEPLLIEFVLHNPLSIHIDISGMQLVARMTEEVGGRLCTSEDAIVIEVPGTESECKTWRFQSSDSAFLAPDFCLLSPAAVEKGMRTWSSALQEDPFFVVSKKSFVLDPGSTITLALGICPLVKGDLEIIGVRSKLFQDVWTYHRLEVKGPLLQDTNYNRAHRVRAQSTILKAKVEQDMPRLTAHLVNEKEIVDTVSKGDIPLLHGQIGAWTLRISNVGTASATSLLLKTNAPWLSISTSVDNDSDMVEPPPARDALAVSHCVGPSGTLVTVPVKSTQLKTDEIIHPGETIDVPILIRAGSGGKQDFYMILGYELFDGDGPTSRRRWLRKMIEVPVYPSLTFSASLMPSFWKKCEHILSVEMTNYRTDQSADPAMHVDKLSIISRHYRIEPLVDQLADTEAEASAVQLGWQERVTMHYRLIPLDSATEACLVTDCPLDGNNGVDVKEYACALDGTFLRLEHAHEEFQAALKKHQVELARAAAAEEAIGHPRSVAQIRRAKSSVSESNHGSTGEAQSCDDAGKPLSFAHPTSICSLCPANESKSKLHILCSWTALGGGESLSQVKGQHFISGLSVRPSQGSKGCPLSITCKHPCNVVHDFSKGPLHVSFEVSVRNRLLDEGVDFDFSMEAPKASFDFVGAELFPWELEAGEELTIPMQAVVSTEGIINLQCVRITVRKDSKKISYVFPLQWLTVVRQVIT